MSEVDDGTSIVVKSQMHVGPGLESQVFLLSRGYTAQGSESELKFRLLFSQQGMLVNSALQLPQVRDKSSW